MAGIIFGAVIGGGLGLIIGGALGGGEVRREGRRMTVETGSAWVQFRWAIVLGLFGAMIGAIGSGLVR